MVRTKADRVLTKAVGGKAPAKIASTNGKKNNNNAIKRIRVSGNPYHPRKTPNWQKKITSFMNKSSKIIAESNPALPKENNDSDVEEENTQEEDEEIN